MPLPETPQLKDLKELIKMKDDIEKEIAQMLELLRENKTDMTEPLVNVEGYPRADLDVYGVRSARHRVICLRNDLKALMEQIEKGLHEAHAAAKPDVVSGGDVDMPSVGTSSRTSNEPFLDVSQVTAGSPSSDAGLRDGDRVLSFGSVCKTNFERMDQIARLVKDSENSSIRICVLRDDRPIHLSLKPKPWSGNGLLGCFMQPC